jgi:tripartite-type tricarboxylate transporter receptor subunit TctC
MRHCQLVWLAAAFAALASSVQAQDWPSRPMTMVVPFAAGGPMDTLARILQPTLGETLGQQIIIENVPGGGGMTGSLRVSQAPVDSHMFVLASIGTHAIG